MVEPSELTSRTSTTKGPMAPVEGVSTPDSDYVEDQDGTLRATKSTRDDAKDMRRMGKDQQLVRNFQLITIMSFSAIATAAWEIGLFVITPGLVDGGRAGTMWSLLWAYVGFGPIYLSMAEMVCRDWHAPNHWLTLSFAGLNGSHRRIAVSLGVGICNA